MTQVAAAPSALAPGTQVGAYRILREVGHGGMAVVYEAINDEICKRVALKVLLPSYTAQAEMEQRFLNEARAVNQVSHPGLVNIFDFGKSTNGYAYIAMEFIDGITLATFLRRRTRFLLYQGLCVLQQLAVTLTAVHARQIVHRDLKPTNIFVMRDDAVLGGIRMKLFDFGIAKIGGQTGDSGAAQNAQRMLTQTGVFLGTPYYIAPEQIQDPGQVTDRADVYSFGVILYQMLSGHVPFEGDAMWVLLRQATERPVPLQLVIPDLPAELGALSEAMLDKSPGMRPSMEQIAEALGTLLVSLGDSMLRRERSLSALSAQSLWQTEEAAPLAGPGSRAVDDRRGGVSVAGASGAASGAQGLPGKGPQRREMTTWAGAALVGLVAAAAAAGGAYWALSGRLPSTGQAEVGRLATGTQTNQGRAAEAITGETQPQHVPREAGIAGPATSSVGSAKGDDLPDLGVRGAPAESQPGVRGSSAEPAQESTLPPTSENAHSPTPKDTGIGSGATVAPPAQTTGNAPAGQTPAVPPAAGKPRGAASPAERGGGGFRRPMRTDRGGVRMGPHRKPVTPTEAAGVGGNPNGNPKGDEAKPDFTNIDVENLK